MNTAHASSFELSCANGIQKSLSLTMNVIWCIKTSKDPRTDISRQSSTDLKMGWWFTPVDSTWSTESPARFLNAWRHSPDVFLALPTKQKWFLSVCGIELVHQIPIHAQPFSRMAQVPVVLSNGSSSSCNACCRDKRQPRQNNYLPQGLVNTDDLGALDL